MGRVLITGAGGFLGQHLLGEVIYGDNAILLFEALEYCKRWRMTKNHKFVNKHADRYKKM